MDAQSATAHQKTTIGKKAVFATILGNTLEVFDLIIFAQFAVLIGKTFFPMYSGFGQLMLTVATYGVGFLVRPLGAFVIGAYADRAGRKAALTFTIALMALGTAIVGLTPSYEAIGIAAPILVLVARLVAGFSAGGELGAATTYLLEMAPPGNRGLYASWQFASQGLGIIAGGLMGLFLTGILASDTMQSWGWRIPFLLGILIAPVGIYIRNQLDETIDVQPGHGVSKHVFSRLWRDHRLDMLWGTLAFVGPTTSSYVISQYMTTYAITALKLPASVSMSANLVAGVTTVVGALVGGSLCDRIGRKLMTVVPQILLLLLIYPAFLFITETKTGIALALAICALTFVRMMVSATLGAQVPEAFPQAVRTTGLSICYGLATTIFGGTAQLTVTWLINATTDPISPAWFLLATNVLTLIALIMLRAKKPGATLD